MKDLSHLYSAEMETSVLGCVIGQPAEAFDQVFAALREDDFFIPAHREIFKALAELRIAGTSIEVSTLHHWLGSRKLAESVGSPGILAEMLMGYSSTISLASYIRIVREKSSMRRLSAACSTISEDIKSMPDSVASVLDRAEKVIREVCETREDGQICDATAFVAHFEEHLRQIDAGERVAAVKTGYGSIDRINGGLKPGGMHVVGGRSGMGKTTVLLNLTENLCKAGVGVGIISLEMDRVELASAIYSFMGDVNSRKFKDKMTDEEWDGIRWASKQIAAWRLWIDDCSLVDVNMLRHKARKMVREGAQVVMVDYIQLLDDGDNAQRRRTRAESVAEMSRSIKLLGKELGVPMIIGAQLNRQAAQGEPGMHQLRESGAIEQDADVVILLRQKDEADKSPRPTIIWNVAKWRGGAAGFDLEFLFDKTRQRFHETVQREPAEKP